MFQLSRLSGLVSKLPELRRSPRRAKLLMLVEGRHDVSFLNGISSVLHHDDPSLPDLRALEQAGEIVFVPVGGGDVITWASRLAPIGFRSCIF